MQITDHLKIEVQHFIEISALRSGFGKDHRKMKAYRTDVKRPTNTGSSLSSAGYMPPRSYQGLKKARHPIGLMTFVLLVHAGNIAFPVHRQPVRIHGLGGTVNTCLKNIFTAILPFP